MACARSGAEAVGDDGDRRAGASGGGGAVSKNGSAAGGAGFYGGGGGDSFPSRRAADLQRVFQENMGVSPKTFASLVRYQNLWQDILTVPCRQIMDEVCLLQYTDQAHLMREFKRYHGMTIPQARAFAGKSVAF